MPNQWVRVTKKRSLNFGKVLAVEMGPPMVLTTTDNHTGIKSTGPYYRVTHLGDADRGPLAGPEIYARAPDVELLGPEECAALDKEYGLKGSES